MLAAKIFYVALHLKKDVKLVELVILKPSSHTAGHEGDKALIAAETRLGDWRASLGSDEHFVTFMSDSVA